MDSRSPSPSPRTSDLRRRPARGRPARLAAWTAALAVALLLGLSPAAAQGGCSEDGRNMQCTGFGRISMESQRDIRGDPIDVAAAITLDTAYADQGARWLLFSVRNVEADGSNPVTIELDHFTSPYGDIVTTRVDHATANELDLWVDILDTPVGAPIDLAVHVGATERGAFRLETLVMAFDRGYEPLKDSAGNDASLFSFTLLGVNKETGAVNPDGGSLAEGKKLPALGAVPLLSAVALLAVLARRRLA
jgi:hypothetical protein